MSALGVRKRIQIYHGDMNVPDLQAMTDALRSHHPGDTVDIVVRRGDATTTLRATLGERGG